MKLRGKCAIVTGSSQGFGLAAAKAFAEEGAHVAMCARDGKMLRIARENLIRSVPKNVKILAMPADVSKLEEVYHFVEYALSEFGRIDVLLCNAGVYGPKGLIEDIDWAEWTQAIAINLNGTVLCCRAVLPHMKKMGGGKIIIMSGGGATKPMPFFSAYAASKAAVVRFAETLAHEVAEFSIYVNSIAPGALNTRLLDEVLKAGPERIGKTFFEQMIKIKEQGGTPLELGASLCVFLASDESNGITGKLISAVWDLWREFPGRWDDLKETDIYTLRRITPRDRGKEWD